MTQILSLLCQDFVAVVSDRRLTRGGRIEDDDTNKLVFFDDRYLYAYTGPAELAGEPTYLWLTRVLMEGGRRDLPSVMQHLTERARVAVRGIPRRQDRRFEICGVGWEIGSDLPEPRAIEVRVSNMHTGPNHTDFAFWWVPLEVGRHHRYEVTGQPLPSAVDRTLKLALRHHARHRADAWTYVRSMVSAVRGTADENDTVGRKLLSGVVPRDGIVDRAARGETVMYGSGHAFAAAPTCQYWPDGDWDGVHHGPAVAVPGGVSLREFSVTYLHEHLGGMEPNDDGVGGIPVTPIALLRKRDGSLVTVVEDRKLWVVAFTEQELFGAYCSERQGQSLSAQYAHSGEELLAAVDEVNAEGVAFNPNGDNNSVSFQMPKPLP